MAYPKLDMPKRTHQPKKAKRRRVHGFMARMATRAGRAVLKAAETKDARKSLFHRWPGAIGLGWVQKFNRSLQTRAGVRQ